MTDATNEFARFGTDERQVQSLAEESRADGAAPPVGERLAVANEVRGALEAVLLVADNPVSEPDLAEILETDVATVQRELDSWERELTSREAGIELRHSADGWRLYSRSTYAPYVEKLLLAGNRAKLTRAAMETLAVVAYRQPVTRSRISAVRGVNVDGVMRTLVVRGLVVESGTDPSSGAILYSTTDLFLERLGITDLAELPDLAPLLPDIDVIDQFTAEFDEHYPQG